MLLQFTDIPNANATRLAILATCVALVTGCSGKHTSSQSDTQLRAAMTLVGLQYGSYLAEKGSPPPDEPAFRKYLQSKHAELGDLGVKSVDVLFRVGRDGQPMKLVVGTKLPVSERPEYAWVAYEQVGLDGTRLACDSRGGVYELSATEFSQKLAAQ